MNDILNELIVVKRSGQRVSFNGTKVALAIDKGFDSVYDDYDVKDVNKVYEEVLNTITDNYQDRKTINVEDIQNIIEECLKKLKYTEAYLSFSEYRLRRARSREVFEIKSQHKFLKAMEKVGYLARSSNSKTPDKMMEKFAKTISKEFATAYLIEGKVEKALEEGVIYLNDLRNYSIGNTSSAHLNTDLEESKIEDYINEIIKIVILVKKDQYKEQTLMNFDTSLQKRLINDFKDIFYKEFINNLELYGIDNYINKTLIKEHLNNLNNIQNKNFLEDMLENDIIKNIFNITYNNTINKLKETLDNNFKKMFTILESIITDNYKKLIICLDNDNTFENNIIIDSYFKNIIHSNKMLTNIYINDNDKVIENIFNKNKTCKIHLLFDGNKDLNYFSNGERIYENINGIATSKGRILNSTSTINLTRIALKSRDIKSFLEELEAVMDLNKNALIQRYDTQASKLKENYNVLFEKGLLYDIDKLEEKQKVRKILRNGAFVMGYTGLIEAVLLINNKDQSELCVEDFNTAFKILRFMKDKCSDITKDLKLNFILAETYEEEITRKLIKIDKSVYGSIKPINKYHYEPVSKFINDMNISQEEKIDLFATYQNYASSIVNLKVKKNISFSTYKELLNKMKNKKIKYGMIGYDN